jgi:L-alanine-DL-glutamate epimerase-like enolase superfamily enzyme
MNLSWQRQTLILRRPFRIAHEISRTRENLIVSLADGLGEAAGVPYYDESMPRMEAYLRSVDFSDVSDPVDLDMLIARLPNGSPFGRAACDIALHDLWGKRQGRPLYQMLGINPMGLQSTSFTIAMDRPLEMAAQALESSLPIIKIKLGDEYDESRVREIRNVTDARLRVDANASWDIEKATRLLPRLSELGVELVEQPLSIGDLDGLRKLRALSPRPLIFVDESVWTSADILAHANLADGVVVKLAKSGGIRGAIRHIHLAHELGMQVMMGCMVETSIAVTAAAHIATLAEFVDLDTPRLISNDPFVGLKYEGARIILPPGDGLGVERVA